MPTSSQLRYEARQSLRGNWTMAVVTFLVYYVITWVIGLLNMIPILGAILAFLVSFPLSYGLSIFYLDMARRQQPTVSYLFAGFNRYVPVFVLYLLTAIFTFLWWLLLVIPGVIAALRYSMAPFILRDNPEIGGLEAIRRSKQLMNGHKGRLFVLALTFIGWFLLGVLTLGIGLLWVVPYFYTALGHFYEDLRQRSYAVPPPPPAPGVPASY